MRENELFDVVDRGSLAELRRYTLYSRFIGPFSPVLVRRRCTNHRHTHVPVCNFECPRCGFRCSTASSRLMVRAVQRGNIDIIVELSRWGCLLNQTDQNGRSPLQVAISNNLPSVVACLVNIGAAANQRYSAFSWSDRVPFEDACMRGHVEIVEELLLMDLNEESLRCGWDRACLCGNVRCLRAIQRAGFTRTPSAQNLDQACFRGSYCTLRFLLSLMSFKEIRQIQHSINVNRIVRDGYFICLNLLVKAGFDGRFPCVATEIMKTNGAQAIDMQRFLTLQQKNTPFSPRHQADLYTYACIHSRRFRVDFVYALWAAGLQFHHKNSRRRTPVNEVLRCVSNIEAGVLETMLRLGREYVQDSDFKGADFSDSVVCVMAINIYNARYGALLSSTGLPADLVDYILSFEFIQNQIKV